MLEEGQRLSFCWRPARCWPCSAASLESALTCAMPYIRLGALQAAPAAAGTPSARSTSMPATGQWAGWAIPSVTPVIALLSFLG